MPKVLLLEEDATYAAEIRRGLVRLGFDVLLIRDGNEGLTRAVSERFDLILLSAELPAVNGFRICNRVKKDPNVSDVPLFMMGNIHEELVTHGHLPTRADDYFTKPLVFDELLARIRLLGIGEELTETTAITQARADLGAIVEMQQKIGEQEAAIAALHRDLAAARANATKSDAQAQEIARLRTSLDDARRVNSLRPPPNATATADAKRLQQLKGEHMKALAAVQQSLGAEKSAADGLRVKLAAAEAQAKTLEARTRDDERAIAKLKEQVAGAAAEKESSKKHIEELTIRRPDVERLREELAALKSSAASAQASSARSLETAREGWTAERVGLEQALRDANKRTAAVEEQLKGARARAETDVSAAVSDVERLEVALEEGAAEVARLRSTLMAEITSHAATKDGSGKIESALASARGTITDQSTRIARLEKELAEAFEKCVAAEEKQRDVARNLTEAARRATNLGDEQTRMVERAAKAEEARDRAVSDLATYRKLAAEHEQTMRAEIARRRDEELAEAAARAAEQVRATEQTLARAHESRVAAMTADRDARLAAERRRGDDAVAQERAKLQELEGELARARATIDDKDNATREGADAAARDIDRERDLRIAAEVRLSEIEGAHEQRLIEVAAQHERALADAAAEARRKLREEREHAHTVMEALRAEVDERAATESIARAHAEALERLRTESRAELARVEQEAAAKLEEVTAAATATRTELTQLRERHTSAVTTLEQARSDEVTRLRTAHAEELSRVQARFSEIGQAHETNLVALRGELEAARAEVARQEARLFELEEKSCLATLERTEAAVASENIITELRASLASGERSLGEARAELERARASAASATERANELDLSFKHEASVHQELEMRVSLLERELGDAAELQQAAEKAAREANTSLAEQTRAWADEVAALRAEHQTVLSVIQAERDEEARKEKERFGAAEDERGERARATAAHEQRVRDLEARIAELEATAPDREARERELEKQLSDTKARVLELQTSASELEELLKIQSNAHQAALDALREQLAAVDASSEAMQAHLDATRTREVAELEASWERRLAEAVEQARTASCGVHDEEMDRLCAEIVHIERERNEMRAGFDKALGVLETAMTETRAELESERSAHVTARAADARTMESLEALVASRTENMSALEREADEARGEIPQLEAEIVVLRSELFSVRRQLDAQLLSARVADAEIGRHRDLLERAERLLDPGKPDKTDASE